MGPKVKPIKMWEPSLRLQPSEDSYSHFSPLTDSNDLLKLFKLSYQFMVAADSARGKLILTMILCIHLSLQIL